MCIFFYSLLFLLCSSPCYFVSSFLIFFVSTLLDSSSLLLIFLCPQLDEFQMVASTSIGGNESTSFTVPGELDGSIARGFQFTYLSGNSTLCIASKEAYYWGCSQGLSLFLGTSPISSKSNVLIPGM